MRDIYAEAGLSTGTLYHYFNSKKEILKASFIFDFQRGLPLFKQVAETLIPYPPSLACLTFYTSQESAALGADQ